MFILIYLLIGLVLTVLINSVHKYNLSTGRVRATLFDVVGKHPLEHITAITFWPMYLVGFVFVYYILKKSFGDLNLEETKQ
jgi:hypothetical protein